MTVRPFHSSWLLALSFLVALALPVGAEAGTTRRLDADSFEQIRSRYAHQPLVVHIWGLTCGPCLEELPHWGELHKRHPGMNLVLIQADDAPMDAVEAAVAHAGLNLAESWTTRSELDEFARARIDPSWTGDMPRTLLISPTGTITTLKGVADSAVIEGWLASLSHN